MMNAEMSLAPVVNDTFNLTITEDLDTTISAIHEIEFHTIDIYPNPASEDIFIDAKKMNIESMTLLDWSGRSQPIIYQKETNQQILQINHIPNGFYVLTIKTAQGIQTKRLVIQRE